MPVKCRCAKCHTPTRFDADNDSIRCEVCIDHYMKMLEKKADLAKAIGDGFSVALFAAERALERCEREKESLHEMIDRLTEMNEMRIQQMQAALTDNCDVCKGERGGMRGNEQRVNGVLMCDYCHAETMEENG